MSSEAVQAARDAIHRVGVLAAEELTLSEQIRDADERVLELAARYPRERGDVTKLEKITFTSVLARLNGSRDEALARERAEADMVGLQLQAQQERHRALLAERAKVRRTIIDLGDVDLALKRALATAVEELAPDDPRYAPARQIAAELDEVRMHESAARRVAEAGRGALLVIDAVVACLTKAETLSSADMFAGAIVSAMKVDALERASALAVAAQRRIDAFVRAVGGAEPDAVAVPDIGTRWFADVFFDNIMSDVLRHRRIERALEQMSRTRGWVHSRTHPFAERASGLAAQRATLERRRAQLFDEAQ